LREVLEVLNNVRVPILVIPGNQDYPKVLQILREFKSILNIDRKICTIDWLDIIGFGGSNPTGANTPYEWNEQSGERELDLIFSSRKSDSIMLLSHAPPFGTFLDIDYSGNHIGSFAIRHIIKKHKPLICVCGHVHESPGIDRINKTIIVNPGSFEISSIGNLPFLSRKCIVAEITLEREMVKKCKVKMI